ncbi:hypothetical protein ACFSKI_19185 [Pseudogracilibacillus auburnensis]|uniref:Uncharacterized protein n=1 Tax=Pseudogracilibacillus auburnensis TaxID=1494959 RepID=A0A2V3W3Z8_9BACI|nr:hypothetical protein [Pseudogracilibacillus auburnensis]MBO1003737.1 hypothetical protein [Pseudogracilibacillus auburnensis]PXW88822.1 hypothetical protein DFR56_103328 [Pseudogracilibacillus auburnensis]
MNKRIFDALKSVDIDVAFEDYEGSDDTYIRFFFLPPVPFDTDDNEQYVTHYVQLDLFTKWDYIQLTKEIKQAMKQAGFKRNFEDQRYETDTKFFHKILRFYIIEEE